MNVSPDLIGIIFREKNTINHCKGVNKIILNESYDDHQFLFTGGRDSIIKLWKNNTNDYKLLCNMEHHIDWVNDMFYEVDYKILFTCSNDKSIMFWRLDEEIFLNESESLKTNKNSRTIGDVHKDYVKSLSYSQGDKVLYTGGYDGLISYFHLEEYYKTNYIKVGSENLIHSTRENSILCIDSDINSKLLLFSAYENQLIGFDLRQKKESFYLRGHKQKINSIKMNYENKLAISVSSDKTMKIWDMRNHRVLHNYEFHTDAILSMKVNESMTKILTGSRNGEIYLTDLNKSKYCKIDQIENKDPILSLDISLDNMQIFCSTSNEFREYKFNPDINTTNNVSNHIDVKQDVNNIGRTSIPKRVISQNQSISCYLAKINKSEIIKHYTMKNKAYILTEDVDSVVRIYNVVKLKLIASFNNVSIDIVRELLDKFDIAQKSWFTVDVKLGSLAVTFFKNNVFSNQYNFDDDFIEKVLEKTNNLTNIPPNLQKELNFFTIDMFRSTGGTVSSSNNFSHTAQNFSRTSMNSSNKKGMSLLEKMDTLGCFFLVSLFDNFVKKVQNQQKNYFQSNFLDPKNRISTILLSNSTMSMASISSLKKDDEKESKALKINNNYFIYSQYESNITVASSIDELDSTFEIPDFLRDIIKVPNLQIKVIKGEKVDVILNNSYRELKVRNANQVTPDNCDELEVQASVTIQKLKEWLINKNYLEVDHLKKLVNNNKESIKINEEGKKIVEKYVSNSENLWTFIDFVIHESIIIKNNDLTLGEIREVFFRRKIIAVYFKYATLESLIERKVIN